MVMVYLSPEVVQVREVRVQVVHPHGVRRVAGAFPFRRRQRRRAVVEGLGELVRLVVDAIEAHHRRQEHVQLDVRRRVYRHLKHGRENVVEHVLKVGHLPALGVEVEQAGDLNQPPHARVR